MSEEPRQKERDVRQEVSLLHKAWRLLTTAFGKHLAILLIVIALIFIVLLSVGFIWYIVPIFDSKRALTITDRKDLVQGLASVVQALAVVLTGTVGLIGLFVTWQNLKQTQENTDKQLAQARESTDKQLAQARESQKQTQESTRRTLELTEQGQITERFTRAIEQLGATEDKGQEKLEIRLGGIYALERIDKESSKRVYHPMVMEVLTAYVRENSRQRRGESSTSTAASNEAAKQEEGVEQGAQIPLQRPPADIQAILDVINRREEEDVYERHRVSLDLQRADLQGADLQGADLAGADLQRAELQGANCRGANFQRANLHRATLQGANFQEANLYRADLREANLQKADLRDANLRGALLYRADLREANLRRAALQGATLQEANLQEANLQEASLQGAFLREANLRRAALQIADLRGDNLQEANLQEAILRRANLRGAFLKGNNLQGADLRRANLQEVDLQEANLQGAFLREANLQGAFLGEVETGTLDQEQINSAYGDERTKLPNGLHAPPGWSKGTADQQNGAE
jgi:uncharacterized protein YjbI with pentapeptide repeats